MEANKIVEVLSEDYNKFSAEEQNELLNRIGARWPPQTVGDVSKLAIAFGRVTYGDFHKWIPPTAEEIRQVILIELRNIGMMKEGTLREYFGLAYGHTPKFTITLTEADFLNSKENDK